MDPRVTLPTLSVLEADAARQVRRASPGGTRTPDRGADGTGQRGSVTDATGVRGGGVDGTAERGSGGEATGAPILLDVREPHEFAAVRVPEAILCPTSSFMARYDALPRDRPIHVICHTGSRSAAVTAFLLRNGWSDVWNVAGGMDAWERAGLEVRRGNLLPGEGDASA